MASQCKCVICGLTGEQAAEVAQKVEQEVRRIEAKYSRFNPDSTIGRINALGHKGPVDLDPETEALMNYAEHLYRLSGGLFDITTGTLQKIWDFKSGVAPKQEVLQEQLSYVGWEHVSCVESKLRLHNPQVRLDLGGFGKEYAADRAAAVMRAQGVESGYVDLGGDINVIGPKTGNSAWRIGIRHPRRPTELVASLEVAQGAIATSGDYERFFMLNGQRYCHILSPLSGLPVSYWQSVSVLAPMTSIAGATCTIAMLKESEGLDFLQQSGFSFLAIDAEGRLHTHRKGT